MNDHELLDSELRDQATMYVLGTMPENEAREYGRHLATCATCRREVDQMSILSRRILSEAPARTPPPHVWDRVLDKVRGQPPAAAPKTTPIGAMLKATPPKSSGAFSFVSAGEGAWEPTGVAGVEARRLHVDHEGDRVTFLARMAPGTSYPSHRHANVEECYVLQGDLRVGERQMQAGDYQRAEKDSVHGVQSTREGCLLLIVSSLHDELVD